MRSLFFASLYLLATTANATTLTIDFENSTTNDSLPELVVGDYVFSNAAGIVIFSGWDENTLTFVGTQSPISTLSLARTDGGSFDLEYLEAADIFAGDMTSVLIEGYKTGGATVSTTIDVLGYWLGVTEVTFDSQWTNLSEVVITGATPGVGGLDNIRVTAVPVPAAIWLFGSVLAGLGWMGRKQAA